MNNKNQTDLHLASQLLEEGRHDDAEQLVLNAIRHEAGCYDAYVLLGDILEARDKWSAARTSYQKALSLRPDDAAIWHRLGQNWRRFSRFDQAIEAFQSAVKHRPDEVAYLVDLALCFYLNNDLSAAVECTDKLLVSHATVAYSYIVAGHIEKALGNEQAAVDAYERALSIDPESTDAIYNLVDIRPPKFHSPMAHHILALSQSKQVLAREGEKANLDFAMARILADDKQYDNAFSYYRSGNNAMERMLRRDGWAYDPESTKLKRLSVNATFSNETFIDQSAPKSPGLNFIFVVGMLRSGTTLVEQILASHPSVTAAGELPYMLECQADLMRQRSAAERKGPIDMSNSEDNDLVQTLREQYLDRLFARGIYGDLVTDKMPSNYQAIGLIKLMFPSAVIVSCTRNPVAICWSLYKSHLTSTHHPYANNLEHAADYYRQYEQMMRYWHRVIPDNIITVRYEALVRDTRQEIEQLLVKCGLPWDDNCMEHFKNRRPVFTVSHQQVRQPMYTTSIDEWQNYKKHLSPLLEAFPEGVEEILR